MICTYVVWCYSVVYGFVVYCCMVRVIVYCWCVVTHDVLCGVVVQRYMVLCCMV